MNNKGIYDQTIIKKALTMVEEQIKTGNSITKPEHLYDYLRLSFANKSKEYFGITLFDTKNRIIKNKIVGKGIESRCHIYIKEVVRYILRTNATGVSLFHNHPSDNDQFSRSDISLTKDFKAVFDILEIRLLDHILITKTKCISMKEEGYLS